VYFWLVNLFVVPLVSVIICLSIVFLLFSFINPLMLITGKILAFLLKVLYESVDFIEVLPYSLVSNININPVQLVLMISILILAGIFIINKRISLLYASLILIIIIQLISIRQIIEWNRQKIFMVGSFKGMSVVNLINGRESKVITDPAVNKSNINLNYSFSNFWINHGITENSKILDFNDSYFDNYNWQGKNKLFDFNNKLILWLCDNEIYKWNAVLPLNIDFVIINDRLKPDVIALKKIIKSHLIIIDSSVSVSQARKWEKNLQKANLKYWIVNKQGAFIDYMI
jgi:hypothetical protein